MMNVPDLPDARARRKNRRCIHNEPNVSARYPISPASREPRRRVFSRTGARPQRSARNRASRLLVFLACVLILFLFSPRTVSAASTGAGHISGQLLNGSHKNTPMANQSVTLQVAQGNSARDLVTITTDAQGRYAFGSLETTSSTQYAIYTLYQGAQYVTDLIDLSKKPDQQVNLTAYDATTSTSNVAVIQASILIDKPNTQAGTLTVSEDFVFENLGDTTYVGSLDTNHGKPNALLFSLPVGARLLTLNTGFDGYKSIQVNTGFASNAAIIPGQSEFAFSFQVPYNGVSYHFSYQTVYPTVVLSLLTPTNIATAPQDLTPKGPTNTQSGTYSMFQAQKLGADKTIGAQLDGLPTPMKATPQQSSLNPALLWLIVLLIILMALAGIGGYFYNTRRRAANARRRRGTSERRSATPVNRKKAAPVSKEAMLREMLDLDKAYEAGKLKKAAYQEQRARLKARLRNVMNEQPEKRTETASKTARSSGKGEK